MPRSGSLLEDEAMVRRASRLLKTRPPRYRVVMVNDDFTPMEFVVHVLEYFFQLSNAKAERVMLQVHNHGSGVCGQYSFDVAESKVRDVLCYAREKQHPLLCHVEAVADGADGRADDA